MQINTVKKSGLNFLVNSSISVPNSPDNSDYKAIQTWIEAGGIVESEFTDLELLDNAKTAKTAEAKAKRKVFQYTNIIVDGNTYKATKDAKLLFFAKVNGNPVYPINWRLADDITFISLTEVEATNIYDAFEAQETAAYTQEDAYLSEIESATTLEEVEAININYI